MEVTELIWNNLLKTRQLVALQFKSIQYCFTDCPGYLEYCTVKLITYSRGAYKVYVDYVPMFA